MRIDRLLSETDEPLFSFEFFPPKTDAGEANLQRALGELRALEPDYVSVTYGAGGSTREKTIDIVSQHPRRARHGGDGAPHLRRTPPSTSCAARSTRCAPPACRTCSPCAATRPRARTAGRRPRAAWSTPTSSSRSCARSTTSRSAAAAFPETHIHATSPEDDLRYLKAKVDAGAQFLITQMFFDNAYYFDFVARAQAIGIDVPIIPGVMPILSSDGIKRMTELSAARLPDGLVRELDARRGDDEAVAELGVSYATLQSRRAAGRRRAGHPLLHAEPLARHARDPQRAEAPAAVGGSALRGSSRFCTGSRLEAPARLPCPADGPVAISSARAVTDGTGSAARSSSSTTAATHEQPARLAPGAGTARHRPSPVLLLAAGDPDYGLDDALSAGARGFVRRTAPVRDVVDVVLAAADGRALRAPATGPVQAAVAQPATMSSFSATAGEPSAR